MKNKFKKIVKILRSPKEFFHAILRRYGKGISKLFKNSAFYMQGVMDIHPQSLWYKPEFIKETGGFFTEKSGDIVDIEPWDCTRRDMLVLLLRTILEQEVLGNFAEVGVYKGSTAKLIHKYAPHRDLYLFDTFSGFEERSVETEKRGTGLTVSKDHFADTSVDAVKKYVSPNEHVHFYPGYFPDNVPKTFSTMQFSFVHLDADLFDPILQGLEQFYPKMSPGGIIVVHDYNSWIGARKAVDQFFKDKKEKPVPMPDKSGSAIIVKQ